MVKEKKTTKKTSARKKKTAAKKPKKETKKAEVKKPEAKPEPKPAEKPEPKIEPKPEIKAEVKKPEAKEEPKKEPPKKKSKKKHPKKKKTTRAFVVRGKRKESVARASIKAGKGVVRFNRMNVSAITNRYMREIITEPLRYVQEQAGTVDISVTVSGGGAMGQAQAARVAIANALVVYFDDLKLRPKFVEIDRSLVVEDTRRVESKKYRGPKARARFQKSYR